MSERTGLWYALAAAILFGVSGVVAADAFSAIDPLRVAQLRSLMAAFVLGAFAYRRGRTRHEQKLPQLALLGGTLAAVTIAFYWTIERIGVGPGVTIQFVGPVMVLVWMRLVQKRRVRRPAWMASGIAIVGIALVTRAWNLDAVDPLGILAGIVAAITFAAYLLVGEHLGRSISALAMTAYGFAFSALIWVIAVPFEVPDVSGRVWIELIWIGLAGTAVPFLLEIGALKRADPGKVGVVATAEPLVATATAWIALGQKLTPLQIVGAVLVLAGVASIQFLTHPTGPLVPPSAV